MRVCLFIVIYSSSLVKIVDLSLLVKRDKLARTDDPFAQTLPPVCINHDSMQTSNQGGHQSLLTTASHTATPTPNLKSPPAKPGGASPITVQQNLVLKDHHMLADKQYGLSRQVVYGGILC